MKISDVAIINESSYGTVDFKEVVHYLDTGNITNNEIATIQELIMGIDKIPSRARRLLKVNDIVYSTVRPNQQHFGLIQKNGLVGSTGFSVITPDTKKVNPWYLYGLISQKNITEYLQGVGEQSVSTYPTISSSDIGNLAFIFPSIDIQNKIGNWLKNVDHKIELNKQINDNLVA
jgi:type I restriction enzyme S subunit